MCAPAPKVTAGAIVASAALSKPGLIIGGLLVSGIGLYVAAGTALTAYGWMVLVAWASITTILLLRRRADPMQPTRRPTPPRPPQRARAEVLPARRVRELEAARPAITYTVEQQTVDPRWS